MSIKNKSIAALFVVLVIILAVDSRIIHNVYNSILGRFFLVAILVFFSMNNLTLGLLFALVIISASNQFIPFVEGMENSTTTTTDTTTTAPSSEQLNQIKAKLQEVKNQVRTQAQAQAEAQGVNQEDIKNAIASKQSNSISVDKNTMKSEDVSAHTPSMINNSSTLTEGFCPCAASVF